MNLKPPSKIELHKSFDENDPTNKPAAEKVNVSSNRATAYTVADLQVATKSFSADNLVSEGRFGRVYRAQLCDQKVCSVTFVWSFSFQSATHFQAFFSRTGRRAAYRYIKKFSTFIIKEFVYFTKPNSIDS